MIAVLLVAGSCAGPGLVDHAPRRLLANAAEEVALEGTIEVLVEDSDLGSRLLYFLISGERRVTLRFLKTPANLTSGTPVRVHGQWSDGVLLVASFERI